MCINSSPTTQQIFTDKSLVSWLYLCFNQEKYRHSCWGKSYYIIVMFRDKFNSTKIMVLLIDQLKKKKKKKDKGNIPIKGTYLDRRSIYSDIFSKRDNVSKIQDTQAAMEQLITLSMPRSKASERSQYVTILYQCTVLEMFSAGARCIQTCMCACGAGSSEVDETFK